MNVFGRAMGVFGRWACFAVVVSQVTPATHRPTFQEQCLFPQSTSAQWWNYNFNLNLKRLHAPCDWLGQDWQSPHRPNWNSRLIMFFTSFDADILHLEKSGEVEQRDRQSVPELTQNLTLSNFLAINCSFLCIKNYQLNSQTTCVIRGI